jgi:hypothetical protein
MNIDGMIMIAFSSGVTETEVSQAHITINRPETTNATN